MRAASQSTSRQASASRGLPTASIRSSHALASAEIACKAAKDRGRNRVEIYADGDQSIVRRYTDITLIGTVRSALLDQRFRLEAQADRAAERRASRRPKYELLLRMSDECGDRRSPPDKFLSAAERYQLAPAIDRWVVTPGRRSCCTPLARPLPAQAPASP